MGCASATRCRTDVNAKRGRKVIRDGSEEIRKRHSARRRQQDVRQRYLYLQPIKNQQATRLTGGGSRMSSGASPRRFSPSALDTRQRWAHNAGKL